MGDAPTWVWAVVLAAGAYFLTKGMKAIGEAVKEVGETVEKPVKEAIEVVQWIGKAAGSLNPHDAALAIGDVVAEWLGYEIYIKDVNWSTGMVVMNCPLKGGEMQAPLLSSWKEIEESARLYGCIE